MKLIPKLDRFDRRMLLVTGIGVFLVFSPEIAAVAFIKTHLPSWVPLIAASRIGEIVAIAGLLSLTLDRYIKERLVEEVANRALAGVGPYLLTYGLPKEFAEEVAAVQRIVVGRQNLRAVYRFRPLKGHPDYLSVWTEVSYQVVNYLDSPQPYSVKAVIIASKFPNVEPPEIISVSALGKDLDGGFEHLAGAVPTKVSGTPERVTFGQEVTVQPNRNDPDNEVCIVLRELYDCNDEDVSFLNEPALNIEVEVAEKPDDLEVEVLYGHRSAAEMTASPRGMPSRWKLERAFLPWTTVLVVWRKKSAAGSPAAEVRG